MLFGFEQSLTQLIAIGAQAAELLLIVAGHRVPVAEVAVEPLDFRLQTLDLPRLLAGGGLQLMILFSLLVELAAAFVQQLAQLRVLHAQIGGLGLRRVQSRRHVALPPGRKALQFAFAAVEGFQLVGPLLFQLAGNPPALRFGALLFLDDRLTLGFQPLRLIFEAFAQPRELFLLGRDLFLVDRLHALRLPQRSLGRLHLASAHLQLFFASQRIGVLCLARLRGPLAGIFVSRLRAIQIGFHAGQLGRLAGEGLPLFGKRAGLLGELVLLCGKRVGLFDELVALPGDRIGLELDRLGLFGQLAVVFRQFRGLAIRAGLLFVHEAATGLQFCVELLQLMGQAKLKPVEFGGLRGEHFERAEPLLAQFVKKLLAAQRIGGRQVVESSGRQTICGKAESEIGVPHRRIAITEWIGSIGVGRQLTCVGVSHAKMCAQKASTPGHSRGRERSQATITQT